MAISAEQLNIILTAKDKAFAAAMDKNAKRIASFAKNANKDLGAASAGFDKLAKGVAAFATLATIQQLGTMVRDAANKLGDLKDASDAIGITTDAMQELTYAAQLSGVSADLLQTSLAKLSKNLGDAAMGGSAAKKALDTLGLSGASLAAMPLDKALGAVADKMSMIENPAQRAALATELFGKSGLAMVNMLADGSAGLNAMAIEAQNLGVVIDRDVIANAAEAADKLDAMSMVISANLTAALVNLMPFVIEAAQNIAWLAKAVNDFLFSGTQRMVASNNALAYAATATGKVKDAYLEYGKAINKVNALMNNEPYVTVDPKDAINRQQSIDLANMEVAVNKALVIAAVANEGAQKKLDATYAASLQTTSDKNAELQNEISLLGLSKEEQIKKNAAVEKTALVETLMTQAMAANGTVSETQRQSILALATQQEQLTIANEMGKIAQTGATKGFDDENPTHAEVKYQVSFKSKIEDDLLGNDMDLYFAYTQQSYWQLYDSAYSSPFRENDYEPEFFLDMPLDWRWHGARFISWRLGAVHQSNGRGPGYSRSWNRLYTDFMFEHGNAWLSVKPWWRMPEKSGEDDNADIVDYMGHAELNGGYRWGSQRLTLMTRNWWESNGKGAVQLDYSVPFTRYLRWNVQVFNGYGENLLDYNENVSRISFGIMLEDGVH